MVYLVSGLNEQKNQTVKRKKATHCAVASTPDSKLGSQHMLASSRNITG